MPDIAGRRCLEIVASCRSTKHLTRKRQGCAAGSFTEIGWNCSPANVISRLLGTTILTNLSLVRTRLTRRTMKGASCCAAQPAWSRELKAVEVNPAQLPRGRLCLFCLLDNRVPAGNSEGFGVA